VTARVRYAPSPTGQLHPGAARTALFNFLVARQGGGSFILRIEDTDRNRFVEGSVQSIFDSLRWLGLQWDEGPEVGGPHFPYLQSERLSHYHQVIETLLADGNAYRCFCTPERLAEMREGQQKAGKPTGYDRRCLSLSPIEASERFARGDPCSVRLLIPPGQTTVHDLLRGDRAFENSTLDDPILLKSDGFPTYHLAATVDDHLMQVTHVLRGIEWLPSAPKHVILYRMLGWEPPIFAHMPVVLGSDRAKLSKRHGAASVLEYRDLGYLPEAMVNFLAFLGWAPPEGRELLSMQELIELFQLERVQPSDAVFDIAKLDSLNGLHIRALPPEEFVRRLQPFVPEISEELLKHAAPLVQTRMARLTEGPALLNFLVVRPAELPGLPGPKQEGARSTVGVLQELELFFDAAEEPGPGMEAGLRTLAESAGWKFKDMMMLLRLALTGSAVTPPLLESAHLMGKNECRVRLQLAIGQAIATAKAGDTA
jgi:glutamyl-tRNA synthetase